MPDLDAHATRHPWREEGGRLLALALYRSGRQGDALAVLRRARALLVDDLGIEPGPALRRLEADILHQADGLETAAERVWTRATTTYDRLVAAIDAGDRETIARARAALAPARGEWAGSGSGLLTLGPVADLLKQLDSAVAHRS